jgi:hypothetical protein
MLSATLVIAWAVGACDPCAGIIGCAVPPRVSVLGRLLDDSTRRPVPNATLDFVRTGGVALEVDSVQVRTRSDGTFRFDIPAQSAGTTYADIMVRPGAQPAYRMRAQAFSTSAVRGESTILPPWSTRLSLPDLAVIYRRGPALTTIPYVLIEFRQTGGAAVEGLGATPYQSMTDEGGYARLFARDVRPLESGDVIGDLEIHTQAPLAPTIHQGVRIPVRSEFRPVARGLPFGAGPSVLYHFEVGDRGDGARLAGVRIDFRRDSGLAIEPATWTAYTEPTGRVAVPAIAHTFGTVYGVITVTPQAPYKSYERSVALEAFDKDGAILYGGYGVGPGIQYCVAILKNGVPAKGITVEFRRTGGIAIAPGAFATVSNDSGYAFMSSKPESEGQITADVTVRPPAPFASFVVRNVTVQAVDGDPPWTLIGTWDIASPPPSAIRIP